MSLQSINVKVCFVMDCTASMQPWIRQAKTKMVELIARVSDSHPNTTIQVGFVGYRDYDDVEPILVIPFQDAKYTMAQIQSVEAEGGDDEAEDVAHGLFHALHMDWFGADVNIVFHIADAPAHGSQFHGPRVSDRFPEGDPDGHDPLRSLCHLVEMDTEYTFVRITSTTDVMIDVFHGTYTHHGGRFRVIDLHPQSYDGRYGTRRENMAEFLSPAISTIVSEAVSQHSASREA